MSSLLIYIFLNLDLFDLSKNYGRYYGWKRVRQIIVAQFMSFPLFEVVKNEIKARHKYYVMRRHESEKNERE